MSGTHETEDLSNRLVNGVKAAMLVAFLGLIVLAVDQAQVAPQEMALATTARSVAMEQADARAHYPAPSVQVTAEPDEPAPTF